MEAEFDSVKATTNKVQQREAEENNKSYWDVIRDAHKDVDELPKDLEYGEWYNNQPEDVQKLCTSSDARAVVKGLNLFRADIPKNPPPKSRNDTTKQSKLDAARNADTPTVKGVTESPNTTKRTFTNEQIAKMSPAEYAKNEAAIDEALMRGEIQ